MSHGVQVGERSGESELQQDISLPMAVGFAVLASCMLVLLFFLHDYLASLESPSDEKLVKRQRSFISTSKHLSLCLLRF